MEAGPAPSWPGHVWCFGGCGTMHRWPPLLSLLLQQARTYPASWKLSLWPSRVQLCETHLCPSCADRAVLLAVGGAQEALLTRSGGMDIILDQRKVSACMNGSQGPHIHVLNQS